MISAITCFCTLVLLTDVFKTSVGAGVTVDGTVYKFLSEISGWTHNYCRNPDSHTGPWCYTTDPKKRWEDCFKDCGGGHCVDDIHDCAYNKMKSCTVKTAYYGTKGHTVNGRTCQNWNSQHPNTHPFKPPCVQTIEGKECAYHSYPQCGGNSYSGTKSTTVSGRTCQAWGSQHPHKHGCCKGEKSNYCRNPDGEPGPWCYTTDPHKRWELCFETCRTGPRGECVQEHNHCAFNRLPSCRNHTAYGGKVSKTISGRTCQQWSSKSPHNHGFTSLPANYCRNPDGEPGPWCYTTDSRKRWELCFKDCTPEIPSLPANYCRNPDYEPGPWCYTTDSNKRWELCFDDCTPINTGECLTGFSPFFSDEFGSPKINSWELEGGCAIGGLRCNGKYCDNLQVFSKPVGAEPNEHSGLLSDLFGQGAKDPVPGPNVEICPNNHVVVGMQCGPHAYCGSIRLLCQKFWGKGYDKCHWTKEILSEEKGGTEVLGHQYFLTGVRCQGSHCDNKLMWYCSLKDLY